MKHEISPIPIYFIFGIENKKEVKNTFKEMNFFYPQYQKKYNNYG